MVEAGEKLAQIALQHVAKAPRKSLRSIQGTMGAFFNAVGIGIEDEAAFKDGLDNITECMMDHAVTERSRGDQTSFGFVNSE